MVFNFVLKETQRRRDSMSERERDDEVHVLWKKHTARDEAFFQGNRLRTSFWSEIGTLQFCLEYFNFIIVVVIAKMVLP